MSDPAIAFGISGAAAVIAVFSGWRGARPFSPLHGPRLIPWRAIMLLATAATFFALAHGLLLLRR